MTNCRLCQSDRLTHLFSVQDIGLHRCAVCGFVQIDQRPTPQQINEIYSSDYFSHQKYDDEFCLARENRRRRQFLSDNGVPPGKRILEIGCGTGDFLTAMFREYDVWGVDVSPSAVASAINRDSRLQDRVCLAGIEELEGGQDEYDAIVMWDVLEHLWDPGSALARIRSSLRPGGKIFCSTPNYGSWLARLQGPHWALMTVPEHMGFFDRRSAHYLFEQRLGLKIVDRRMAGKWVSLPFLVRRLRRNFPERVKEGLVRFIQQKGLRCLAVFVPFGDLQYLAAEKTKVE